MPVRILAVGKKHESWVAEGIERYQKRLAKPFDVQWVLLPHSISDDTKARQDESERLRGRIREHEFIVLLDERGKMINSPALSKLLLTPLETSKPITIIIGGAYGVDESVHARADFIWSLSPLVFPHQLVRLMLVEQIYRAQDIASNGAYHHQ